jgi:cytochrome c biogenesis protein CcmG/thiol:disulfide interchange protein DsbE
MMKSTLPQPDPSAAPAKFQPSQASTRNLLLFGGVMLVGILFLAWIGRPPQVVTIGQPLPQIDLQPLLDNTTSLSNTELAGKLAVLHFWGTWCPPCKEEFPEFVKLAGQFAGNDQIIIASVSCSGGAEYDLEELKRDTAAFMSEFELPIPTYADPAALTRERIAWILPRGSLGYPTTLLIDRDGKIIELIEGYYPGDMEKLAKQLESQL